VRDVCSETAHLHLRATNSTLLHALDLMDAWGFSYGSCLVTLHRPSTPANYWQEAHAFVLLGVRGRLPFVKTGLPSWIECEGQQVGSDSMAIRQLIEVVSPGPYLQLFGTRGLEASPAWVLCDEVTGCHNTDHQAPEPVGDPNQSAETNIGGRASGDYSTKGTTDESPLVST
jgi:hypothetical protein